MLTSPRPLGIISVYATTFTQYEWWSSPHTDKPLLFPVPVKVEEAEVAALVTHSGPPVSAYPLDDFSKSRLHLFHYLVNKGLSQD
jgi:hypothetical protein